MTTGRGSAIVALTLLLALGATACSRVTQIVLVIDTDMTVPADMDHLDITVAGAMESRQIPVDLSLAGAPSFPLTLGLTPASGTTEVRVAVLGTLQGGRVVEQSAQTTFVDGESRMLRMVLVEACLPISCTSDLTCESGGCVPPTHPGTSLPPWTGTVPARPGRPNTTPIGGRTLWSSGWHSAAMEGTTLYAWGQNSDGQVGNGNTQNAHARRPVKNVQSPLSIGLGQLHSCICDRGGQALCWGRNADGQLGTGDTTASLTPVLVPGANDCVQIAGGAAHTCMVRTGGAVSCWGNNSDGQVGSAAGAAVTAPSPVVGLTDVVQVLCGEKYTCARRSDGTVVCWGDNSASQLGDGTTTDHAAPALVIGLTDVSDLAIGRFFACALHPSGQVACWGRGSGGVLGPNSPTADSPVPVELPGVTDATQLAGGQQHACAIRKTGVLSCWGGNGAGQLGNGTVISSVTPVDVLDIAQVSTVAAGSVHTCARHAMGLACWGENIVNQLGDGSTTNRSRPVSVAGFL